MERNLLLAVALSIGVYVTWFAFVEKRHPARPPAERSIALPGAPSAQSKVAPPSSAPERPRAMIELKAPRAEVTLDPAGASIASYRYEGPLGKTELVPKAALGFFSTWPEIVFAPAKARWPYAAAFEGRHPLGIAIHKEFRFGGPGELSLLRVELKNVGRRPVQAPDWSFSIGPGLGTVTSDVPDLGRTLRAVALYPPPSGKKKDRLEKLSPDSPVKDWKWLAVDNRYFIAAAWPERREFAGYHVEFPEPKTPLLRVTAASETLAPGAVSVHDVPFYLGPKSYLQLESMKLGLEKAVDFGWFDSLGRTILKILYFLEKRIGNYGWSIIVLTLLLQAALFPLTLKSLKSAAAMKRLQPEVARLQQKYSKDPQRLNQELMQLYRSKGANPLGGCLPMLLQLPIFVALFNALRNSWDLHGAPWIFWIHDLSARDPFYVLPLVMGGFMFIQNKFAAPPAADPSQAQVMKFMPVIFTFMFLKFPAGLVLYWLTSSILSTTQQLALRDKI